MVETICGKGGLISRTVIDNFNTRFRDWTVNRAQCLHADTSAVTIDFITALFGFYLGDQLLCAGTPIPDKYSPGFKFKVNKKWGDGQRK